MKTTSALLLFVFSILLISFKQDKSILSFFVNNCHVEGQPHMFNMVYIKTNERMGGYVKNIYVKDVPGGSVDFGVPGIETDVLYQWKSYQTFQY